MLGNAMHQRSGEISWTTIRDGITAVDSSHPASTDPTGRWTATVIRSRDCWVRAYNSDATSAPSLVFDVYVRMADGDPWVIYTQLNGGTAIDSSTNQALAVSNRFDYTELVTGLGAWGQVWVIVTGTIGTSGKAYVRIGHEEP